MRGLPRLTLTAQLLLFAVTAVAAFGGTTLALRQGLGPTAVVAIATPTPTPTETPELVLPPIATVPAVEPTETEPPAVPITIAFGGDVHGEPPIANLLARGDNPFEGVQESLERADITVINLETALGSAGSPQDKTYTFQADPALADRAVESGVDIVNLANNHGLDYGVAGADETKQIAEAAGLVAIGYGQNAEEAYAPHIVEVGGQTVAFLGLSRVLPTFGWQATADGPGMASAYDVGKAVEAVLMAAEQADHVVVTIHWGSERATCANGTQVELANAMVRAGADVIVGHHPHVLQGVVGIDGALVAYSLGNFVFYATNPVQRETGVLTVQLSPDGVDGYVWEPARISNGVPLATDANADIPLVTDPAPDAADEESGETPAPAPAPSTTGQPTSTPSDPAETSAPTEPDDTPTSTPAPTQQPSPTAAPTPADDEQPDPGPDPEPAPDPEPDPEPSDEAPPEGPFDPSGSSLSSQSSTEAPDSGSPEDEPEESDPAAGDVGTASDPEDDTVAAGPSFAAFSWSALGRADDDRSLRRAVAPDNDLPPLRQPDPSGSGCAPIQ